MGRQSPFEPHAQHHDRYYDGQHAQQGAAVDGRLSGALLGLQLLQIMYVFGDNRNLLTVDDPAGDRRTDHTADNHAEGGRGNGGSSGTLGTQGFRLRAKGRCCAKAAL